MKDVLQFILEQIVEYPDELQIEELTEEGKTTLVIHCKKEDMGKIIGKSGRIIKAIRDIVKLVATKQNAYVNVTIAEE